MRSISEIAINGKALEALNFGSAMGEPSALSAEDLNARLAEGDSQNRTAILITHPAACLATAREGLVYAGPKIHQMTDRRQGISERIKNGRS